MKKILAAIFTVLTVCSVTLAQDTTEETSTSSGNFGIGLGLDYGGIGAKASFLTSPKFALFAGLGYNFDGLGFNGGGILRLSPDKRVCPTLTAMYGYNAVIKITGDLEFSESYYGPSFGFGLEFHGRNNPSNFFNLELLVPVRNRDFKDDLDAFQNNPFIDINDPFPINISLGYHFGF
jgi:hypothetical protein